MHPNKALLSLGLLPDTDTINPSLAAAILGFTYFDVIDLNLLNNAGQVDKQRVLEELASPSIQPFTPTTALKNYKLYSTSVWVESIFPQEYIIDDNSFLRISTYLRNSFYATGKYVSCHVLTGKRVCALPQGKNKLYLPSCITGLCSNNLAIAKAHYIPTAPSSFISWPYDRIYKGTFETYKPRINKKVSRHANKPIER